MTEGIITTHTLMPASKSARHAAGVYPRNSCTSGNIAVHLLPVSFSRSEFASLTTSTRVRFDRLSCRVRKLIHQSFLHRVEVQVSEVAADRILFEVPAKSRTEPLDV